MTAPALDRISLGGALEALARHHEDIGADDTRSIVDVLLHEVRTGARYPAWDHITAAYRELREHVAGLSDVDAYGKWTCPRDEAVRAVKEQLETQFADAIADAVALHQEEVGRRG